MLYQIFALKIIFIIINLKISYIIYLARFILYIYYIMPHFFCKI